MRRKSVQRSQEDTKMHFWPSASIWAGPFALVVCPCGWTNMKPTKLVDLHLPDLSKG